MRKKKSEQTKKDRNQKAIITVIAIAVILVAVIVSYFGVEDLKSYPTKQIEAECVIDTKEYMNRKVFTVNSKQTEASGKVIIYFHGGSYFAPMTDNHWNFIEDLVNDTGDTVIIPDYPLSPKYNYQDVFKMVVPLYKEILDKNDTKNIIMMGDSAGGGLAIALDEKLEEESIEQPIKTVLISPWLDVSMSNEMIDEVQENDDILNKEKLKVAGVSYSLGDINNYLVSPINGDLSKLRNITIFTGTYDILNPDVHILVEKAKNVGVNIEIKEYEKAKHIWLIDNNSGDELYNKGYEELLLQLKVI